MTTITIITFAIVEAAGGASDYEKARLHNKSLYKHIINIYNITYVQLEDVDSAQRTSAIVMRSTLIFILPLVFISYVLGSLAEYEQNIYLYSLFTVANGVLGALVFFAHCFANATVSY